MKNQPNLYLIIMLLLAITSLFILYMSVDMGMWRASLYLESMGGSMDTTSYSVVEKQMILINLIIGGVLFFTSSMAFSLALYKRMS